MILLNRTILLWVNSVARRLRWLESLFTDPRTVETFWGVVRATGPKGEADYTDNRYWIERASGSNTTGDETTAATIEAIPTTYTLPPGAIARPSIQPSFTLARVLTATNLEEGVTIPPADPTAVGAAATFAGAHTLAVGTPVLVKTLVDRQPLRQPGAPTQERSQTRRYIFRAAPQRGWGTLITEYGDYLTLRPVGVAADDASRDFLVKKPYHLRVSSYDGKNLINEDGVVDLHTSTGHSARTVTNIADGSDTEDQVVVPKYIAAQTVSSVYYPGSLIEYGMGAAGDIVSIGTQRLLLEDLNRWQTRAWTEAQ